VGNAVFEYHMYINSSSKVTVINIPRYIKKIKGKNTKISGSENLCVT
jgi:hypothetical protein